MSHKKVVSFDRRWISPVDLMWRFCIFLKKLFQFFFKPDVACIPALVRQTVLKTILMTQNVYQAFFFSKIKRILLTFSYLAMYINSKDVQFEDKLPPAWNINPALSQNSAEHMFTGKYSRGIWHHEWRACK